MEEPRRKKLRIAELSINEFSKEGYGLGSIVQQDETTSLVEVPFSMPGDQVQVSLFKRRKGVSQSQLLEVVHPSPDRVAPRCMHFGQCGGCRWQHVPYEQQLQLKEERIFKYLEPYLHSTSIKHAIIPCSPPWQYRNKVELSFSTDKAMNKYLGFILHASRGKVFHLQECHLVSDWMNQAVHAVREWWMDSNLDAYHATKDRGALRTLTLRAGIHTGDRMVILTVSGNADYALKQSHLNQFVECLRRSIEPEDQTKRLSVFLRIQQIAKGQKTNFYEMHLHGPDHICEVMHLPDQRGGEQAYKFNISPMAFFQPNTKQAEKLYTSVLELVKPKADDLVYDLYCGTGTLGISFARHVKQVIGIELSPESVLDARENIKNNQLGNVTIHQGDVAKVLLTLLAEENEKPTIVIVDPPRMGLDNKAIQHLIEINAPKIAYVSCNPTTQADNVKELVAAGYNIAAVQPVDQFPQTVHVENIVVLIK